MSDSCQLSKQKIYEAAPCKALVFDRTYSKRPRPMRIYKIVDNLFVGFIGLQYLAGNVLFFIEWNPGSESKNQHHSVSCFDMYARDIGLDILFPPFYPIHRLGKHPVSFIASMNALRVSFPSNYRSTLCSLHIYVANIPSLDHYKAWHLSRSILAALDRHRSCCTTCFLFLLDSRTL